MSLTPRFNADVAEGLGNEAQLMPFLSSCNIACGGHAGNTDEMDLVVQLATQHKVKIGAHPSYADRKNFGRTELNLTENEIFEQVSEQVALLHEVTIKNNTLISYLKPHGALYHRANSNEATALTLVKVIEHTNASLALMGLPNSVLEKVSKTSGIPYIAEAFADRRYHQNGTLVSRTHPEALLTNKEAVLEQVRSILLQNKVGALEGMDIPLHADSVCFHSDTPDAETLLSYCFQHLAR